MPVWRYMELCLTHPELGYYVSRDPLGREGDFTHRAEVSQMFGELLGLGRPRSGKRSVRHLAAVDRLGPGRGTMMADALRALRWCRPSSIAGIHLVEINPGAARQAEVAALGHAQLTWHDSIDDIPDGPAIIFANEYFDVLPIHQVVKRETGWHERTVEIDANGELAFGAAAGLCRFEVCCRRWCAPPRSARCSWRPDASQSIATVCRPGRRAR